MSGYQTPPKKFKGRNCHLNFVELLEQFIDREGVYEIIYIMVKEFGMT